MTLRKFDSLLCRPVFRGDSMACRFAFVIAILTALLGAPPAKAQAGLDPSGIWLKDPINPATGKPQVDDKNPNPSLARRPIIGLVLFSAMQPSGPNKWSGQIYNADDGNSYASNISVADPDTLKVEGCVGALCGGENWTRSAR